MYLENIIKIKEEEITKLFEGRNSLKESLKSKNLSLIAEIKKSSPSKGIISKDFNPEKQLNAYIEGGADAISILTDKKYFQGSPEILKKLRNKTSLPILRKDFIINPIQIYESFLLGADVVLLIAKILTKKDINNFLEISKKLELEVLVEVHDKEDLEKVLGTKTEILGINNRNLENFTVDITTTEKILNELEKLKIRNDFYIISESGIKERNDIIYLENLKVDGVLIGEVLMKEKDPSKKIKELFPEKEFIKNA